MILNTDFGLIWTTRWHDEKKNKILKNSQFAKFAKFRMKTQLFPRRAQPNFFLLFTLIALVILHTAFGLIWTTPWPAEKKLKFSKIRNSRNSQNSVWKPNFFLGALNQNFFFAFYSHYTGDTPYRVWFDLDNSLTRWKKIKIRNPPNSQNSVWKPNFFLGALNQKFFCFTLSLHWWYSIPRLVWFGQLLNPMTKTYF